MDWNVSKLSELCKIQTGRKDVNSGSASGKYPFFTCAKQHTFSDEYSFDCEALLIAGNGVVGNTSYFNGKFEAYQRTYVLSDFVNVLPQFLFLLLDGVLKDSLVDKKLGNTMPYIKVGMLKDFLVPLPPIPEQQRIVAILDQAFADIEKARANAERNLKNARELFDSYLFIVFSDIGEKHETEKLSNICSKITDGVHKKPIYTDEGIPFIKINNLTHGAGISFDNVSYISKEDHELFCKRTHPEKGDILITKDGTIGVVRVIETDVEFSIFVSVALIKPLEKSISPYLKYVLESPLIQSQINPQGAALKHLYLRDLREFLIPITSESQQSKIVEKLDALSAQCKQLEFTCQKKLNSLDELKKSLLQKAFSGELTKTEGMVA